MIRDDPSRSELIRRGLAVRVDPVRLLYLPLHDSLWREQTLAATKLFLSLTCIDFAVAVSSRAVGILVGPCAFFRPYHFDAYGPDTGPFLGFFQGNCARGRTRHMIMSNNPRVEVEGSNIQYNFRTEQQGITY